MGPDRMFDFTKLDWRNKTLLAAGAVVLIGGFGLGFLTASLSGGKALNQGQGVVAEGGLVTPASGFFGKPRAKSAPRSGGAKPLNFAVWKQRVDSSAATAAACVEMSKPLDGSKDYGDYVVVTPALATAPAVSVKGSEICVGGLGFSDRRVTLLKGLPAQNGDKLDENIDVDFTFGEKPPYVGFVGNGVILPREDGDGVAIETVNVSKLKVEVWYVSDRNLVRKSISAPSPVGEGGYDEDWGDDSATDIGVKIWDGYLAVSQQAGERTTTVFPLGASLKSQKSGAYMLRVSDASGGRDKKAYDEPALARRWVLYTDMAVTTFKGQTGLDAVVRSLKTAKPQGGVRVALVAQNGDVLSEAKTDATGRVRFPSALLAGTGGQSAKMLMAYGGNNDFTATDLTRSPMDLTSHGVGGRQDGATEGRVAAAQVDSFVYTDRGIYRPGEPVHIVALVRAPDGRVIKDRKGALVITRPSGIEAYRLVFTKTKDGFAGGDIRLPKTAPRGQWKAHLEIEGIEGASGETQFAVEDFAPQRLGVEVAADSDKPLKASETRPINIMAKFLYGATGSNLATQAEARIRADANPFPAYKDYVFGDQSKPYEEKFVELPSGVTDGSGRVTIPFAASEASEATQPLSVLLTASVFEPGGRPVRESETLRIRTRNLYIGVKHEAKDSRYDETPKMGFDLIAVDADGKAVDLKGAKVTLIAEHWDYDWYVSDGRWNWRSTHRDAVISSTPQNIGLKGYHFDKALDWGDYRIEVEHAATNTKTVVRFSSGWGAPTDGTDAPDFVRLTPVRASYGQGDTVEIKLQAPYKGEAQIAVATDRLIDLQSQTVGDKGDTIRLKTDASWGGGAYVLVSVIQPRDAVSASKPRRALGLVYVSLEPKSRALKVAIPVAQKPVQAARAKDGQAYIEVPVEVSGQKIGEKVKLTLSVVDQGILNLTKFKTPDPKGFYFGKRALRIDFSDDYGRLLDPNLGAAADLKVGGDQLGGEGLTTTPIRTTAIWSGVFTTGLDGKTKVRIPVSRFNGEVRLMAVAWTDEAVGSSDNRLVVREPVVAELALPRFLSPGDTAYATLELNNVEAKEGLFKTIIKGFNGIVLAFEKTFTLKHDQRVQDTVTIKAPNQTGVSQISLNLSGQGYDYANTYPIQTRLGWGQETRTIVESQGVNAVFTPSPALLAGMANGTVTVSYSTIRGVDVAPIGASLSRYVYGCTEQITSAATPWLYMTPSMVGNKDAATGQTLLKQAVDKLMDRQTEDGAFGLWRAGDQDADGFIGAYATDLILEARAMGVPVAQDGVNRALNAMREMVKPQGFTSVGYRLAVPEYWGGYTPAGAEARTKMLRSRASAYALYVLAKAGSGDMARLRWYHDVQMKSESSPLAIAQVGAGLARMGDRSRAHSAFVLAASKVGYEDKEDWYQTPLRDLAGVIALAYEAGEVEIARSLTPRLERAMKSPDMMNTQEKAFVLRAAFYMMRAAGPMKLEAQGVTGGNGRYAIGDFKAAKIKNASSGALWRTVTIIGTPMSAPQASAQGLRLERTYLSPEGARLDPNQLVQGQRVIVVITGQTDFAEYRPIVIDDALPAGLEIETILSNDDTQNGPFRFVGNLTTTQAQEARDDRYIAALSVMGHSHFSVAYVARAVTAGDFFLPGTMAHDFYRPHVNGRLGSDRMRIAPRG